MNAFPDTSFLCAVYRKQANSAMAAAYFATFREPLSVSGLLLYEFRQSTRLQIWLHNQDPKKGFAAKEGEQALADLESDLANSVMVVAPVDWPDVHQIAERLSKAYTKFEGQRAFDVLHVATALHLGAREFLSFDERQRKLAKAEGLNVRL